MTIIELRRLQTLLLDEPQSEAPSAKDVVRVWKNTYISTDDDDEPAVMMLLAAVAVAIAWWTYRGKAAPGSNIQRVFDCIADGHFYLLPIPRSHPCFCGGGIQFKNCHGRPPNAAPLMAAKLTIVLGRYAAKASCVA